MRKKKVKLSIIEDYVKLYQTKTFCDSFTDLSEYELKIKEITNCLNNAYEILIFKLGLMDESFLLLKRELSQIKFKADIKEFENYFDFLKNLYEKFKMTLYQLKFSNIEINYLTLSTNNFFNN